MTPLYPIPAWRDGRIPVISSGFRTQDRPRHDGVDIAYRAAPGDPPYQGRYTESRTRAFFMGDDVPVFSVLPGVVVAAKMHPVFNGEVWVHHPDQDIVTRYDHMRDLRVRTGDVLLRGAVLGTVWHGRGTPFRHLHFEMLRAHVKGSQFDPAAFLEGAEVLPFDPTAVPPAPRRRRAPARRERGFPWWILMLGYVVSTRR